MTTGRINQVTILSPGAEARRQTPRREQIVPSGAAKATPIATLQALKTRTAYTIDSIAPTEFLKGWSATSHARRFHRSISVAYTPQEETAYASSHAYARLLSETVPKDLMNI